MSDHTSKQFDAEMEAIRSGVLSMGGLVEQQMTRAIEALEQDEDARLIDAVGADEREINQLQIHDRPAVRADHRAAPADRGRPADDPDGHQDRQRPRAHRRRDQEDRVQGRAASAAATGSTRVRYYDVVRVAGGAQQMLRHGARRVRAARRRARPPKSIDRGRRHRPRVQLDHAPADQLHDGGPADDHARRSRSCSSPSRSSGSAIMPRTSRSRSCRS